MSMAEALRLAVWAGENGDPPFGAVICLAGKPLASATNEVLTRNDQTAHAEMLAIRSAARLLGASRLDGCTIYCSCEPCVMCAGAIVRMGIAEVTFAANRALATELGFPDRVDCSVTRGLLLSGGCTISHDSKQDGAAPFHAWSIARTHAE